MNVLAISFVFGAVLWAAGAAAAPVIIHLIMRTKPRKIVFPALRFVKKTHQANISKLRLKHLILLAMRIAAVLLAVVLVARAQIADWRSGLSTGQPAAVVVAVDNSASMAYLKSGMTSLGHGKKLASEILEQLPAKSAIAVVKSSDMAAGAPFLSDRALAIQQMMEVPDSAGGQPVGPAIGRAAAVVGQSSLQRKEVLVISDLAGHSFRDMASLASAQGVNFTIVDSGPAEDLNVSLGDLKVGTPSVPLGVEVEIETSLRSARTGGDFSVKAELNNELVSQQPVHLTGGSAAAISFTVKPQREGPAHGKISISQTDPIEMDNTRYFTINVGAQAKVLVVRDATTVGRGAPTSYIMSTAIAPPGSDAATRRIITADRFDENEKLDDVDIVLLADVASLTDAQWQRLDGYVRGGGRVWVVAGALPSPASYNSAPAQAILPAAIRSQEELPQPAKFETSKLHGAMLEPFMGTDNPPLSQIEVYRRLALQSVAPGASVVLAYADKAPAIITRTVGDGVVLLWNFSPAPAMSNLSSREQLVVLAARAVTVLTADVSAPTMYTLGQSAIIPLPRGMRSPTATLRKPGETAERTVPVDVRSRTIMLPCDRPGHWTIELNEGQRRRTVGFSVNVPASESDLTRIADDKLRALFPPGQLTVVSDASQLANLRTSASQPLDLVTPLLVALLILLTAESFFANRFYKRAAPVIGQTPSATVGAAK